MPRGSRKGRHAGRCEVGRTGGHAVDPRWMDLNKL